MRRRKSGSPAQASSRKAARSAGSSFSIASKKIARSPIALHSTTVVVGDVACGASSSPCPR